MNILVTHQFAPNLGGSYLYTKELTDALKINHKLVVINGHEIDHNFDFEIQSIEIIRDMNFDLIIIMQSQHFKDQNIKIKNARIINIIHSEVYDLDNPLIHNRAKYIAVRNEIKEHLIKNFNIDPSKITTLINPINKNYYSSEESSEESSELDDFYNEKFGLFACGNIGQIRWKAAIDFALFCRELNYKSLLMAPTNKEIKNEFDKFYDRVIDPAKNVNKIMQKAQISGGILKGRTYWEAKLCGKPVIEYMVNPEGDILNEIYETAPTEHEINQIKKNTDPEYIANEIIKISNIEEKFNINEYFDAIYNLGEKYDFLDTTQINPTTLSNYWYQSYMNQSEIENLLNFYQILQHAQNNRYEQILIIQNNSEINNEVSEIFYDKFNLFKSDWQILIFSDDFSGIALKQEIYIELKNNIDLKFSLDRCLSRLISKYKTYVFKEKLIKHKNLGH